MTAGADTLAWDIFRADNHRVSEEELRKGFPAEAGYARVIAEKLRERGYVRQETVDTVRQLKDLQSSDANVVLMDGEEEHVFQNLVGGWAMVGHTGYFRSGELYDMFGPTFTILSKRSFH